MAAAAAAEAAAAEAAAAEAAAAEAVAAEAAAAATTTCTHRLHANWHSLATSTEVFPCFFRSCKANAGE
jgi:hypothetical protein